MTHSGDRKTPFESAFGRAFCYIHHRSQHLELFKDRLAGHKVNTMHPRTAFRWAGYVRVMRHTARRESQRQLFGQNPTSYSTSLQSLAHTARQPYNPSEAVKVCSVFSHLKSLMQIHQIHVSGHTTSWLANQGSSSFPVESVLTGSVAAGVS